MEYFHAFLNASSDMNSIWSPEIILRRKSVIFLKVYFEPRKRQISDSPGLTYLVTPSLPEGYQTP
jgi:hypothetical protein